MYVCIQVETTTPVGMSQDDQTLSRAIEASLHSSYNEFAAAEEADAMPVEESVREGGR